MFAVFGHLYVDFFQTLWGEDMLNCMCWYQFELP